MKLFYMIQEGLNQKWCVNGYLTEEILIAANQGSRSFVLLVIAWQLYCLHASSRPHLQEQVMRSSNQTWLWVLAGIRLVLQIVATIELASVITSVLDVLFPSQQVPLCRPPIPLTILFLFLGALPDWMEDLDAWTINTAPIPLFCSKVFTRSSIRVEQIGGKNLSLIVDH